MLITAHELAARTGQKGSTIRGWAERGVIPATEPTPGTGGGRWAFDADLAVAAVLRIVAAASAPRTNARCPRCGLDLPLCDFAHVGSKRRGHCNECHRSSSRERRRSIAVVHGRMTPEERRAALAAARNQKALADHEQREARGRDRAREFALARAKRDAERKGKTLTPEQNRRAVARQRERYNTDPEYQARIKAKKIRRKRAIAGTQVEPINRELVAARDGWRCCICSGPVTRETWSLDHVVPLSEGGSHTYGNVALAHLECNNRRGAGRLPSQLPLFAKAG